MIWVIGKSLSTVMFVSISGHDLQDCVGSIPTSHDGGSKLAKARGARSCGVEDARNRALASALPGIQAMG